MQQLDYFGFMCGRSPTHCVQSRVMCAGGLAAIGLAAQLPMIDYQTSMFDASIMTSPISITTL
ncbi:hypothetical protein P2A66_20925, partial [Xanthomonas perforans]